MIHHLIRKKTSAANGKIGLIGAVAIGIGGMVGGGIFAVLGLAAELGRGGTPIAFLLAGLVALVTSYSYARLSVTFPSAGGTVTFLNRGFGQGLFAGGLNILLWISYMVMLALYAHAFGSYGATAFPAAQSGIWVHLLTTLILMVITVINALDASLISRFEDLLVAVKITILVIFVALGSLTIQPDRLEPAQWPSLPTLMAAGMLIFVAYEGFELIANTAKDIRDPGRNLPRSYYLAISLTGVLYFLIAAVTVGTLSIGQIQASRDFALAEAARPLLGDLGFVMITIAALLSTASAINATLYGTSRLSYVIARENNDPLSHFLQEQIHGKPIIGLLITGIMALLLANLLDLSSISNLGSAGFLIIFAVVNWANVRLAEQTKSSRLLSGLGVAACLGALTALLFHTALQNAHDLWVVVVMIAVSFLLEMLYRVFTRPEADSERRI